MQTHCHVPFCRSYSRRMLILVMLSLLGAPLDASAENESPTYQHRDPYNGENFNCTKCEPGTHLAAHCTATMHTKCNPCKTEHYTELWNYLPRCLYCRKCLENQEVETECTPLRNRVCRCREGYYWLDEFCVRHTKCGRGFGVQAIGTPKSNTVCQKCTDGYFSNSSSALGACVKHRECANGQTVLFSGSAFEDVVCGSCEDLANNESSYRTFISAFLGTHLKRVGQLKKFVARIIYKSDNDGSEDGAFLPSREDLLHDQIKAWLAEAPLKQLKQLPEKLKDVHLSSITERLNKRLNEIKQHSSKCA